MNGDHREYQWELFRADYRTLLKYLNILYPHLTSLTLKVRNLRDASNGIRNGALYIDDFNFRFPFIKLQRMDVSVLAISNAVDLFSQIEQWHSLKSVSISVDHPISDDSMTGSDLIAAKLQFLQTHLDQLEYLSLKIEGYVGYWMGSWRIYKEYLSAMLTMIEEGHVYNGCLQFKARHYFENMNDSLCIARIIVKIQQSMCNYNKSLTANDINEKKLTLCLPEMNLEPSHRTFLKFWMHNAPELCDDKCQKFVFY